MIMIRVFGMVLMEQDIDAVLALCDVPAVLCVVGLKFTAILG